jgi:hypothetical protein
MPRIELWVHPEAPIRSDSEEVGVERPVVQRIHHEDIFRILDQFGMPTAGKDVCDI